MLASRLSLPRRVVSAAPLTQRPILPTKVSRPLSVAMVKTESQDVAVGEFQMPEFELLEPLTGEKLSSKEYFDGAKASVVVFMCNHCPFVVLLKEQIVALAKDYTPRGVKFVGVSSNSTETHPQDGPESMAEDAKKLGYDAAAGFRYLFDGTQDVAKQFRAACTPEFFVFKDGKLFYHGQFDDARPSNGVTPTGKDVRAALDDILSGKEEVSFAPKKSLGCNIKWSPGNEPSYFHTVS